MNKPVSNHRPTLLVLAAAQYQLPFIHAARHRGYRVLTADNRPDNPGHAFADASFDCDTTDVDAVLALARRESVDGILAAATDVALQSVAAVCDQLRLAGPGVECARQLTGKLSFRRLQHSLGLPHPDFDAAMDACPAIAPPWIVKPNRASGSKGIRIVEDPSELAPALQVAQAESADGQALVEAYLGGHQGTVEGVLANGAIAAYLVTDRLTAQVPQVATRGHRTPAGFAPEVVADLLDQLQCVFTHLGYRDGPFDCDFLQSGDRAVIVEMTPRAGGNSLVQLLAVAAGFDMPGYAVEMALGRAPLVAPFKIRPAAVEILTVSADGKLQYDEAAAERIRSAPGVQRLSMDKKPGDAVRRFRDGRDRVGELVACADTREILDSRMAAWLQQLDLRASECAPP